MPPPPSGEALKIDISARIMWGDDPGQVRADVLKQGASPGEVDRAIRDALATRHKHFRNVGMRDLAIGILCATFGAIVLVGLWEKESGGARVGLGGRGIILVVGASVAGIVLTVRGARRLVRGGKGEGAGSDIDPG